MNHTLQFNALQMIGTQRSGSNLLRLMLNQLPEMFAPHPPHILLTLYPLLPIYGDLMQDANFRKLIDDMCTLVELNPVPWDDEKGEGAIRRQISNHVCSAGSALCAAA